MSQKSRIILFLLILALGAGAYVAFRHSSTSPARNTTALREEDAEVIDDYLEAYDYEATVKVTTAGFNPFVLHVKPNTKVFWESDGTRPHIVVPDKGSQPAKYFGATKPIAADKPYAAKFVDIGNYNYHDESDPKLKGVIIVSP